MDGPMNERENRKPLYQAILESSVIATCLAGFLTTVIGGYLLDRAKENSAELERAREKQEALITNQLQVLEELNSVLAEYKLAAEFVVYDIVERGGATLDDQQAIVKSIDAYDRAARAFLASSYRDVFRVRIYFADPRLCDELEEHLTALNKPGNLIAVDGALSVQIAEYKRRSQPERELEQAQAGPIIKNIGLVQNKDDDRDLEAALKETREALRAEFEKVSSILEGLADGTVAKR